MPPSFLKTLVCPPPPKIFPKNVGYLLYLKYYCDGYIIVDTSSLQNSPYPLTATIIASKSEEDLIGLARSESESSHNSSSSDEMCKPRAKRSLKITPSTHSCRIASYEKSWSTHMKTPVMPLFSEKLYEKRLNCKRFFCELRDFSQIIFSIERLRASSFDLIIPICLK